MDDRGNISEETFELQKLNESMEEIKDILKEILTVLRIMNVHSLDTSENTSILKDRSMNG